MRILSISLTLLLCRLNNITGHTVPGNEIYNKNTTGDVYEIHEGETKVAFVNPKPQKPTLREIIYYHIIEKPYEKTIQEKSLPVDLEIDDSMRPFTNSHGYQFLDHEMDQKNSPDNDRTEAVERPDHEEVPETTVHEMAEGITESTTEKTEIVKIDESKTDVTKDVPTTTEFTTESVKIDNTENKMEVTTEIPTTAEFTTTIKNIEKVAVSNTSIEEIKESKMKHARKSLFDRLKEVYSAKVKRKNDNITEVKRSKRDINYDQIPEAPRLEELDYSKYPGLKVYATTEQPEYKNDEIGQTDSSTHYPTSGDARKELKDKINDIFVTLRPYDYENNGERQHRKVYQIKPTPRTYGMNLTDDQGYVWNNLWTPNSYTVGEPVSLYEVQEFEVSTVEPKTEPPIATDKDEDIFVNVTRNKVTKKPPTMKEIPNDKPKNEEKPSPDNVSDKKDDELTKKDDESDEAKLARHLGNHNKKPNTTSKHPNSNQDIYMQLMNSEKFWKWLAQWTSTYMDVLSDRIKDMVKDEVTKQMSDYAKLHKDKLPVTAINKTREETDGPKKQIPPVKVDVMKNKTVNTNKVTEPVIKDNNITIDGRKIPITNTTNFNNKNDTMNNDTLRKHREKDERKPKPQPIRNNTQNNDERKSFNKNNTKVIDYEENHNEVTAQTVYGSSTGNDNVTNIFIFYPDFDISKIIEKLEPYLNKTNNFLINEKDKHTNAGKVEKPENVSMMANKEPQGNNPTVTEPPKQNDNITITTKEPLEKTKDTAATTESTKTAEDKTPNQKDVTTEPPKTTDRIETINKTEAAQSNQNKTAPDVKKEGITTPTPNANVTPKTTDNKTETPITDKETTTEKGSLENVITTESTVKIGDSSEKTTEKQINSTTVATDTSTEKTAS